MTRKLTLFLVCAFEIALILFMATWTAWAHDDSTKIKELEGQISELQKRITILELSAGPEMKAATYMVSRLMQADKEYKDKEANLKSASEYLRVKD